MIPQVPDPKSRRKFLTQLGSVILATSSVSALGFPRKLLQDSDWKDRTPMPYKLQEIYCCVLNNKIHIAGGMIAEEEIVGAANHHIIYDPEIDIWLQAAAIPEGRHHLQMVSHGGYVYGLGGFKIIGDDAPWSMQAQTWKYDISTNSWEELNDAPVKHGETVGASLGDRVHLVGGRTPHSGDNSLYNHHADTDHHLVFDPSSNSWDTAAPALSNRNSAAGAVIEGLWYVVGGRTVTGGNVDTLEIYDPKEDKWRTGAPMPQAQGGLAAAEVKGRLYAFGGEYFDNGGGVYRETWMYNPRSDKWRKAEPMRSPRHGLAGVAIDKHLFAIGGALEPSGSQTTSLVEVLEL